MTSYPQAAELYRAAVQRMHQTSDLNQGLRDAARLLKTLSRTDLMSTVLWREHERLLPDRFLWGNLELHDARAKAGRIESLAARLGGSDRAAVGGGPHREP